LGDGAMEQSLRDGRREIWVRKQGGAVFLGGSGYLRLPRELGAGGDRWSSTWLPAIYPVREGGEGARLRTLGRKPRRMGRSKVCWPWAGL
jgi:hypothetical protein